MSYVRFYTRQTTFRQLEIFRTVAELGSVSAAASQLYITQPTVSTQIAKLEHTLKLPLFELIGRRLFLTEAGRKVLQETKMIFESLDRLESELSDLHGLKSGLLRLSVVTTAKYLVPSLLGAFCRQYPAIEVDFCIANREQIVQRLESNLDDLYVFSQPPTQLDIVAQPLADNPLVVIAQANHALANAQEVTWQQLEHDPFLIREVGSGTRIAIERYFAEQNWVLRPKMTIASNEAIKESVAAGLGIAILSRHTLLHSRFDDLVELPVAGLPIMNAWYLVHWRQKILSPVAKAFLQFVMQQQPLLTATH